VVGGTGPNSEKGVYVMVHYFLLFVKPCNASVRHLS